MADPTPEEDLFYRKFACPTCGGERVHNFGGSSPRNPLLAKKPCYCDETEPNGVKGLGDAQR